MNNNTSLSISKKLKAQIKKTAAKKNYPSMAEFLRALIKHDAVPKYAEKSK